MTRALPASKSGDQVGACERPLSRLSNCASQLVWALIASLYIGNVMLLVVAVLVVLRLLKKLNPAGG